MKSLLPHNNVEDLKVVQIITEPSQSGMNIDPDSVCPACGEALIQEKCKVVCRSSRCQYRLIFNCSEF